MVSFEHFVIQGGSPIYAQLVRHIKRGIAAGSITDQDEMPSRRVLSALLGVNPNTVQKAYRLLEEEHLLESHLGTKSYITVSEAQVQAIRVQLVKGEILELANALKQMGVPCREAVELLRQLWGQGEEGEE